MAIRNQPQAKPAPADPPPPADEWLEQRITLVMSAGGISRRTALRIVIALQSASGPVEINVRHAVAELARRAPLSGQQAVYAQSAYRLAAALDADDEGMTGLAGVSRELRASLDAIWKGVKLEKASDTFAAGLATPE